MQQRWVAASQIPLKERSYQTSEYMQSSYLRMRHIEESLPQSNYFDLEVNPAFKKFVESFEDKGVAKRKLRRAVSINDRSYAVQKITNLHEAMRYCRETLFTAVNIMDRYLMSVGHWNFPRMEICLLATTALILAAKMKERYAPSIEFTLEFLTDEEKERFDEQAVFDLEGQVLVKLGFDLHFPGPVDPMHRFLHLLDFNKNQLMAGMAFQICKFSMNAPVFLNYRPSVIAACAVILSANIH